MAERAKKHHYVPQLILRGFAKSDRLVCHDLLEDRSYRTAVGDAAAQNDYNTIETIAGDRSDAAETLMSSLETAAAPPLERVRSGAWLRDERDKVAVARFLTLQYLRVPRQRSFSDALLDSVLKLQLAASGPRGIAEAMTARGEVPTPEAVLEEWAAVKSFDWRASKPSAKHVVETLDRVDEFAPMLFGVYSWCVVHWERRYILTGDNPLLLVPAADWPAWSGVGLGTAGRIYFGLDRSCALVLVSKVDGEFPDGTALRPSVASARDLCRATASAATARIYHHPDDKLTDLVGNDFKLPVPQAVNLEDDHAVKLRTALAAMGEHAYRNPGEPHPMSGKPGSTFRSTT